jgi:hypothetical protein
LVSWKQMDCVTLSVIPWLTTPLPFRTLSARHTRHRLDLSVSVH